MKKILLFPSVFGVLAVTDKKQIMANVTYSGRTQIIQNKNNIYFNKYNKFLIRGFFYLIFGIYYTIFGIFFNYQKTADDMKLINKAKESLNVSIKNIIIFIIIAISLVLSIVLLGVLPIKLSVILSPKNFDVFLKRTIISLCKMIIIYIIFLLVKYISVFKEYYRFNSVCFEYQKQNNQTNFLAFFVFGVFFSTLVVSLLGVVSSVWYFIPLNALITVFCFCVAYELFYEIQKVKWLNRLFFPLYFLIIEKPSRIAEKCVKIALRELEIDNSRRNKMQINNLADDEIAFSEAYVLAREKLEKAGRFEKSDLDFIFCEILNKKRAELRLVKSVKKSDFKKVESAVEKRANGEPITKIFCHANFYGLDFIVTKDVLSPRMDTEVLVEQVLKDIKTNGNKLKVVDVGTGSGAIAVTIAKMAEAKVTAVDVSDKALSVAKQNATKNGARVNFVKSDLFSSLGCFTKFDIIVSNPPYIPSKDIDGLDEEVKKYDPILALDGGADGLNFYRAIIDKAPSKLVKNGRIYLEVGINQAQDVKKLLQKNFKDIRIVKDYNKIERVVCATLA